VRGYRGLGLSYADARSVTRLCLAPLAPSSGLARRLIRFVNGTRHRCDVRRIAPLLAIFFSVIWRPPVSMAAGTKPPSVVVALELQKPRIQVPADYRPYLRNGCIWQGTVQLHGRNWLVDAMESPPGRAVSPSIWFVLLQAADATGLPGDRPPWMISCPTHLFLGDHAYRFEHAFEGTGKDARLKLTFTDDDPNLYDLRVQGSDIQRLQFFGKYLALIEKPSTVVRLPADTYSLIQITLGRSNSAPWFMASLNQTIKTSEASNFVLRAGSPLTNRVTFTRRHRTLRLSYQLVDAEGRTYLPIDRSQPPRFEITRDDRIVASGSFEFG
jgi:hypothetical protein